MSVRVEQLSDGVTLYLGDARDVLPKLSGVDALVTDPVWPNCPAGLLDGSDDPLALWRETWSVMPPLRRAAVVMRNDSDPRFLAPVTLPFVCIQVLPYAIPSRIGRVLGAHEVAYGFGAPVPVGPGRRLIAGQAPLAQPSHRPPNGHPCSRPQIHSDFVVRWWSEPGETVLDPFTGSGTTAISCLRLGRRFVGVEIDETYFDIACRRIERALREPAFDFVPMPRPAHPALDLIE